MEDLKLDGQSIFFSNFHDKRNIIYHYTKKATALKKILRNNEFSFSHNKNLNDPKENKIWFNSDIKEQSFDWRAYFDFYQLNVQLACFTIDNIREMKKYDDTIGLVYPGRGFNHPRMWAQYSDNHEGICLAFDKDKFALNINKVKNLRKLYSDKIMYVPSLFHNINSKKIYNAYQVDSDNSRLPIDELALMKIKQGKKTFFFRKLLDWKDENEYRFVVVSKSANQISIPIDNSLVTIILGWQFPEDDLEEIIELGKKYKVHVYQMEYYNGSSHIPNEIL